MLKNHVSGKRKAYIGLMKALMAVSAIITCALELVLMEYVLAKGASNISWE